MDNDRPETTSGANSPILSGGNPKPCNNSENIVIGLYDKVYMHPLDMEPFLITYENMLTGKNVSSVFLDSQSRLWISYADWDEAVLAILILLIRC